MKTLKKFMITLFVLLTATQAWAVPARPGVFDYKLPDGTKISIELKGDEFANWAVSPDGYTLLRNSDGYWEYAVKEADGDLILSGKRAHNADERLADEQRFLSQHSKKLSYSSSQIAAIHELRKERSKTGGPQKAYPAVAPVVGERRIAVILIDFPGKPFTKTKADYEKLFNQVGYSEGTATGSVHDYFADVSGNQLDFEVDVYGIYTMPNPISYYDHNSNGSQNQTASLIVEASAMALADGCDFSNYDYNNDGYVDGVHLIFAGYDQSAGAPEGESIWATAWTAGNFFCTRNDKRIKQFSMSSELRSTEGTNLTPIGVICHELSHVFGVPDFYDTDYAGSGGQATDLDLWCLMASGSWNGYNYSGGDISSAGDTPSRLSAWCRNYFGWTPAVTLTSPQDITLPDPATQDAIYRINTSTANEYFLIENRRQHGWDNFVPANGMLIYHIDENYYGWNNGKINANPAHRGNYIKEALGDISMGAPYGKPTCPLSRENTNFTDFSTPNAKSWAGQNTNRPITEITHNRETSTVSFKFMDPDFVSPEINLYSNNMESAADVSDWTLSGVTWDNSNNGQLIFATTGSYAIMPALTQTTGSMRIDISAYYGNYIYLHTSPDGIAYTDQGLFTGSGNVAAASKSLPAGTRYVKFVARQDTRNDVYLISVNITGMSATFEDSSGILYLLPDCMNLPLSEFTDLDDNVKIELKTILPKGEGSIGDIFCDGGYYFTSYIGPFPTPNEISEDGYTFLFTVRQLKEWMKRIQTDDVNLYEYGPGIRFDLFSEQEMEITSIRAICPYGNKITFDSDGGTLVASQMVCSDFTPVSPIPFKQEFTFAGWYKGDSETPFDFSSEITEDITLKARWTPGAPFTLLSDCEAPENCAGQWDTWYGNATIVEGNAAVGNAYISSPDGGVATIFTLNRDFNDYSAAKGISFYHRGAGGSFTIRCVTGMAVHDIPTHNDWTLVYIPFDTLDVSEVSSIEVYAEFYSDTTFDIDHIELDDNVQICTQTLPQYTVSIAQPANGSITVKNGSATVSSGTQVDSGTVLTLQAVPNSGYELEKWWDNNTENPRTVTLTADISISATFKATTVTPPPTPKYTVSITQPANGTITVKNGSATVSSGTQVDSGTVLTLQAVPNSDYELEKWWDNSTENPRTVTLAADISISATFKTSTAISDIEKDELLKLYPNPIIDGKLTVEIPANINDKTIQIYDLNGKLVLAQTATRPKTQINVAHLPNGTYIIRIGGFAAKIQKQSF